MLQLGVGVLSAAGLLWLTLTLDVVAMAQVGGAPAALRIAPPPMTFDHISPKCWNFTHGNYQRMEFYSPGYPGKYTNDTDCVMYLEAPPNFKIQLDFRDTFKIEASDNCKYDFLEVRDGPFAYSPLIQRFCGDQFPPLITSTSRYLWMRFKSDDLVQEEGFKAIYYYNKDTTQNDGTVFSEAKFPVCRQFIEVSPSQPNGVLSSSQLGADNSQYRVPRHYDCTWEIHTDRKYGIFVKTVNLTMTRPQRCDHNYLALYKHSTLDKAKYVQHCAGPGAEMKTRENRVFVRLYGRNPAYRPEMTLVYTIYRNGVRTCDSGEFRCGGMCLPHSLKCNGLPNCPDEEDEVDCVDETMPASISSLTLHTIIAGSIGGVIFTAVFIGICVSCHYKRREARKEEAKKHHQLQQQKQLQAAQHDSAHAASTPTTMSKPLPACPSPGPHTTHLGPRARDNPHRFSLGSSVHHSSDGGDPSDMTDIGNYKRFLHLEMAPTDEETSPCPSLYSPTALGMMDRSPGISMMDRSTGMGVLDRSPGLEPHYPRFTSWRPDDPVPYPYSSLKKHPQFSIRKPFSLSPENKYITSVPLNNYMSDSQMEH